jgi:release factor glutamine methyltransferase
VTRLRAAGCVFAEEEAALLLAAASGPALDSLVARRVAGEPLEHLLGWAAFAGLRVVVTPGVFVPRTRSELLVESVVQLICARPGPGSEHESTGLPHPRVLDLCCGSGAVGAAVAARVAGVEVWASDVDPVAVACARQNLRPERVVEGDLYDGLPGGLRGSFDVVVVNAPYVPTDAIATMPPEARDHEPRVALDGGADGVELHRRVAAGVGEWLRPGGRLVVETSRGQSPLTVAACEAAGLAAYVVTDGERDATAVVATAP